ncbi:D(2) dopamine receptor-like [Physella acuta]|uniref:D(2) dopamine receptor-like n=1 Tax=Physella acuta TaxID=109671 RepID=UPI0027DE216A|nr:D(2) dopamine receptor-like [Physella acuta]
MNSSESASGSLAPTDQTTTSGLPSAVYKGNALLIPVVFLMSALIIFGNMMTLLAIQKLPSLQTKSNVFVASLAAADMMVGVVLIPYGLWLVPAIRQLVDEDISICLLLMSAGSSAVVISILSLLLVALDRLVFISRPFFYQRVVTNRVIAAGVALPWTLGLTFGNSQWLIYAPTTHPPQCVVTYMLPEAYYKYAAPWMYFASCSAVLCMYAHIAMIARRQRLAIRKHNTVRPMVQVGSEKITEKNWKAVKMMMTVFGVFFVCWTPRFVLYSAAGPQLDAWLPEIVYDLSLLLGLLNSGVNFLVYPAHNHEFRRAFKLILCCTTKEKLVFLA